VIADFFAFWIAALQFGDEPAADAVTVGFDLVQNLPLCTEGVVGLPVPSVEGNPGFHKVREEVDVRLIQPLLNVVTIWPWHFQSPVSLRWAKPAASDFSMAISTARLARSRDRIALVRAVSADCTFATSLDVAFLPGLRNGNARISETEIAGYIEAVVCRSISSQMTGNRKYTSNSSGGIAVGLSTANPESRRTRLALVESSQSVAGPA
jgi:hypothetical protein